MVILSIDNEVTELHPDSEQQLSELVTQICGRLPANRTLAQVAVDGKAIPLRTINGGVQKLLHGMREVQVQTADVAMWAVTGIDTALSTLKQLQRSVVRTAEMLREGEFNANSRHYNQCLEGLDRLLDALSITRSAAKLDFTQVHSEGQSLAQLSGNVELLLEELCKTDIYVHFESAADRIEFELLPTLCSLNFVLSRMRSADPF